MNKEELKQEIKELKEDYAKLKDFDSSRFEEIREEIANLALEALELLPRGNERFRARSYWYSQIIIALRKDHDYFGSSMVSMEDSSESVATERSELRQEIKALESALESQE